MLIRLTNARTGGKPVFIDAECIAAMAARTDDRLVRGRFHTP